MDDRTRDVIRSVAAAEADPKKPCRLGRRKWHTFTFADSGVRKPFKLLFAPDRDPISLLEALLTHNNAKRDVGHEGTRVRLPNPSATACYTETAGRLKLSSAVPTEYRDRSDKINVVRCFGTKSDGPNTAPNVAAHHRSLNRISNNSKESVDSYPTWSTDRGGKRGGRLKSLPAILNKSFRWKSGRRKPAAAEEYLPNHYPIANSNENGSSASTTFVKDLVNVLLGKVASVRYLDRRGVPDNGANNITTTTSNLFRKSKSSRGLKIRTFVIKDGRSPTNAKGRDSRIPSYPNLTAVVQGRGGLRRILPYGAKSYFTSPGAPFSHNDISRLSCHDEATTATPSNVSSWSAHKFDALSSGPDDECETGQGDGIMLDLVDLKRVFFPSLVLVARPPDYYHHHLCHHNRPLGHFGYSGGDDDNLWSCHDAVDRVADRRDYDSGPGLKRTRSVPVAVRFFGRTTAPSVPRSTADATVPDPRLNRTDGGTGPSPVRWHVDRHVSSATSLKSTNDLVSDIVTTPPANDGVARRGAAAQHDLGGRRRYGAVAANASGSSGCSLDASDGCNDYDRQDLVVGKEEQDEEPSSSWDSFSVVTRATANTKNKEASHGDGQRACHPDRSIHRSAESSGPFVGVRDKTITLSNTASDPSESNLRSTTPDQYILPSPFKAGSKDSGLVGGGSVGSRRERKDSGVGASLADYLGSCEPYKYDMCEAMIHKLRCDSKATYRDGEGSSSVSPNKFLSMEYVFLRRLASLCLSYYFHNCPPTRTATDRSTTGDDGGDLKSSDWDHLEIIPYTEEDDSIPQPVNLLNSPSVPFNHSLKDMYAFYGTALPQCITNAMDHLVATGLTTVGLFRKSGLKSRVQLLRDKMIESDLQGIPFNDFHQFQPHDIADLIKSFFRQLPVEPLFPKNISLLLDRVMNELPPNLHRSAVQCVLLLLPDENREALQCLLIFCHAVSLAHKINQMTASNIAVCLCPTLFYIGGNSASTPPPTSIITTDVPHKGSFAPSVQERDWHIYNKTLIRSLTLMIEEGESVLEIPHNLIMVLQELNQFLTPKSIVSCFPFHRPDVQMLLFMHIKQIFKHLSDVNNEFQTVISSDGILIDRKYLRIHPFSPLCNDEKRLPNSGPTLWKISAKLPGHPVALLKYLQSYGSFFPTEPLGGKIYENVKNMSHNARIVLAHSPFIPKRHSKPSTCLQSMQISLSCSTCLSLCFSLNVKPLIPDASSDIAILASDIILRPCGSGMSHLTYVCCVDFRGHSPDWLSTVFGRYLFKHVHLLKRNFDFADQIQQRETSIT